MPIILIIPAIANITKIAISTYTIYKVGSKIQNEVSK